MKLVVKIIIIMCLLSVVFSLFGCSPQPVKADSEISSISITQNHMNRAYCYAFSAYEDNDKYFFNAWYVLKDGENSSKGVDIQNIEITETEFSEFARLNEKYGFADYTIFNKANSIKQNRRTTKNYVVTAENKPVVYLTRCAECGAPLYHITDHKAHEQALGRSA